MIRGHKQRPFRKLLLGSALIGITISLLFALQQSVTIRPGETAQQFGILPELPTKDNDADCPFRNSSIYRSVYVYPSFGEADWKGAILSSTNVTTPWPWLELERQSRLNGTSHYDIDSQHVQYSTELLVRELLTNPRSCLWTTDPEAATLFYVPYLPSVEHHRGNKYTLDYEYSPYGRAIMDILVDKNYTAWESTWGLTADYWRRRNGSDHILVFSEPMHGLWHPRFKRGSFHYRHSQMQLTPPIVVSVELSTSFVEMYPNCAAKNILMPYPNTNGRWFNGWYDDQVAQLLLSSKAEAALPNEPDKAARPAAQYLNVGIHGTCKKLRRALTNDYRACSRSYTEWHANQTSDFALGLRISTFCPAPGGDSPSAKRMFDCLFAGSIPVIMSHDFVWPFTKEFDPSLTLDPLDFSLRYQSGDIGGVRLNHSTCQPLNASQPSLDGKLATLTTTEIQRLRSGVTKASELYSWYKSRRDLPENPLRDGVLPDGGAAHALVAALEQRASGARWPACAYELEHLPYPDRGDPNKFKC